MAETTREDGSGLRHLETSSISIDKSKRSAGADHVNISNSRDDGNHSTTTPANTSPLLVWPLLDDERDDDAGFFNMAHQMQPSQMQPSQMQPSQMQPSQMQPSQMQPSSINKAGLIYPLSSLPLSRSDFDSWLSPKEEFFLELDDLPPLADPPSITPNLPLTSEDDDSEMECAAPIVCSTKKKKMPFPALDEGQGTKFPKTQTVKIDKGGSSKEVREPRYSIQTRSDVDFLKDGYIWRISGINLKDSPHNRFYYRCTIPECPVRKQVERARDDPGQVITTYEGTHTHPSVAAASSNATSRFSESPYESPYAAGLLVGQQRAILQLEEIDLKLDQLVSLQSRIDMYIKRGKFEDFCKAEGIHGKRLIEIGRGRLTAALFPGAFYRHLRTLLNLGHLRTSPKSSEVGFPRLLQEAANLVVKELRYAKKESQIGESQSFQFFNELYNGEPVDVDDVLSLGGLIAICEKFPQGGEQNPEDLGTNYSIECCIVQHDLTGAYLCRRVVKQVRDDQLIENGIGVLGVEVTGKDIHVENIRDDGSYYSGTLKDFSYPFVLNNNGDSEAMEKQCATELFGHVKGAEFLAGKEYGLKCSPLLAIALTIATQKNSTLELKWNRTYGHMKIDGLEHFVESGKMKWQVLYTDKINELGLDVEWGMEQVLNPYEMTNSQASGTSNEALASIFGNAVQQRRALGLQFNLPGGVGIGGNMDIFGSEGRELARETHSQIMANLRREARNFVETPDLDAKHARVKDYLLQGRLPDAEYNYLVVWDDADNGHVSVYWAMEDGKLEWITDILLPCGKRDLEKLFKEGLKGLRMKVKRGGSKLVSTDPHKPALDLISRFKKHKKLDIDSSMKEVPNLLSNDEWEHLIGPQAKYSGKNFFWEATFMRAIISSRTSFLSGAMLDPSVLKNEFQNKIDEIGYCSRKIGQCNSDASRLTHHSDRVAAWGQFSKAPASLVQGANLIKWGGLKDENDLR